MYVQKSTGCSWHFSNSKESSWRLPGDILWRSSRTEVFCRKGVLKHLCQSLFFNKVAGLRPATLLKKRLAQVFSCEFCEISKNSFSYRTPPVAASVCDIFAATKKFRTWVTFLKSIYKQKQPHRYSINKGVLNKFR